MIFQFILSFALLAIMGYGLALRRRAEWVGNLTIVMAAAAAFFVWRPSEATAVANFVGIGRGADLIFYCWVVISLLLILNLHLKLRSQAELTTQLVRHLALSNPLPPGGPPAPPLPSDGTPSRESRV